MPGSYTLELELFTTLGTTADFFEIWADGSQLGGGYSISSSGSTISVSVPYGGALPTSLEFRFNDSLGGVQQIEVRSVKINDRYVNTNNYLSGTTLNEGGSQTVAIGGNDFLFDASEPAASEFTVGATQTFTAGNDTYRNYNETVDQVFNMLAGRDVALLGSGNDKVAGDAGDDYLYGYGGNDLLYGGADNDRLYGGDGDDRLYGGDGNDRVHGDAGNDEIHGGAGNDKLQGNDGNDIITGGDGLDSLHGGDGDDYLFGDADADSLTGGNGADTLDGGSGNDLMYGGAGIDHMNGGDDNDIMIGNQGADVMHGDDGDDTIYLMNNDFAATEQIYGGAGTDELILAQAMTIDFTTGVIDGLEILTGSDGDQDVTYEITQALDFTTIDLGGGTDNSRVQVSGTVDATSLGTPTVTNAENGYLTGSGDNDDLTISGAQLDSLIFGAGTINFDTGGDILRLTSTSADLNTLGGTDGSITGLEEINASTAGAGVTVSMSGQTESFTITGGSSADTLTGGSAADIIDGGNGDNILTGLGGNDTITGGTGNDTILGGGGDDILIGGAGNDTIYGATIIGESGVETAIQTDSSTWHTVTFSATILNPIVKMSNMTNNDGDPYSVRVRDLTETGFEWQIDEFDYLDGSRILAEEVSWLAVSEGTHTLDNGAVIQAGRTTVTNESQTIVTFNSAFGSAPVVLSQVMTDNDSAAVVSRNRNITTNTFRVNLLEEEVADGTHSTEEIGWIAIEAVGSPASGFLVGATTPTVDETVTTINFGSAFDNIPVFVHDQQTTNGGDTSWSQADGITTTTARVLIGEEQSKDAEINHPGTESVGYFALNEGLLTSAGGGDNTFTGGAGLDTLYGGDGLDTFIFESASAFADRDTLADFSTGEGDILDISDLIVGAFSGTITDYVNFDDSSGTDTVVQVDANGLTGGSTFSDIAIINGITGLDEATLYTNGNIIV